MKNSPFHKKDVTILIRKYVTGIVRSKKTIDGWTGTYVQGLEVTCNYQGTEHSMKQDLSYNRYGNENGWHPILYDDFFDPYMHQILQESRKMVAGETKRILVSRR